MMEGITIIVLEEILMANGLTVLMMWFLLFCRRKNRESLHVGDKIYDGIAIVNLVGALSETIAFLVDGKQFTGSRQINYISNSICFIGTVSMGMLWCMYVELRIYRNYKRMVQKAGVEIFPWRCLWFVELPAAVQYASLVEAADVAVADSNVLRIFETSQRIRA